MKLPKRGDKVAFRKNKRAKPEFGTVLDKSGTKFWVLTIKWQDGTTSQVDFMNKGTIETIE